MQRFGIALAATVMLALLQSARADTFFLRSGGHIEGDLLNPDQNPRKSYDIAVAGGGQITLPTEVVEKVQGVPPELAEYEKLRRQTPNTVQDQMKLADWCKEHSLSPQRKACLERVLQLDPDQPDARRLLGYRKVKDQWMTHDDEMIDRGLVQRRSPTTGLMEWITPQEADNRDNVQRKIKSEAEWRQKIRSYRAAMDGRRPEQGIESLQAIHDPAAIVPLAERLNGARSIKRDSSESARKIYIEVLGRFDTHESRGPLAACAIDDPVREVRLTCLDLLEKQKDDTATDYFLYRLNDKHASDETIERAGEALGRIKDPKAVPSLIEHVYYTRTEVIPAAGGPGAMSGTFGKNGGPSGLSMNQKPQTIERPVQCREVLDALVTITGQNFGYNPQAWGTWYRNQIAAGAPIAKQ
jgi:hypothetical protein